MFHFSGIQSFFSLIQSLEKYIFLKHLLMCQTPFYLVEIAGMNKIKSMDQRNLASNWLSLIREYSVSQKVAGPSI